MESGWVQVIGQFVGTAIGSAIVVIFGLRQRRAQNKTMTHNIAQALSNEVKQIREQVEVLKNTVGVHTLRLNEVSKIEERVAKKIEGIEQALPAVEGVVRQAMDFLERAKAKPLETKPLPGGHTAIKPRKG